MGIVETKNLDQMNKSRLYWRCRRGMLELDLLLRQFLDCGYDGIDESSQQAFNLLLDYPDAVLFDLLFGRTVAADQEIARVIQSIRTYPTN